MTWADDRFLDWFAALEKRHLARLSFAEVRRGLQALSSLYVERRGRIGSGAALDGAGKRAAFALFYGPLHFLLVRGIVRALGAARPAPRSIVDLGCGTGAAGAAWALEAGARCRLAGIDRSGWAVEEARWSYRVLGVAGRAFRGDLLDASPRGRRGGVVAAFTVNELGEEARAGLLERLLAAGDAGARVLVVEPIARRKVPWWDGWAASFRAAGGRADLWRFPADLPGRLRLLDRAARLDHRELTARSLWLGPPLRREAGR
jgi:SAM-dependent methyltransferase